MSQPSKLFHPLQIGPHTLSNRLVLAPLTRFRAQEKTHVPLPFVKDYYTQRASTPGTLLITEGTFIAAHETAWPNAPGIWSAEQVAAWKDIVESVHAAGGVIFMQLAATGRVADPEFLMQAGGWKVKGPSAIPEVPDSGVEVHPLTEAEIEAVIGDFVVGAKNAVFEAGFDGVELHGANGYLIDQFTQANSNQRSDAWGGSVERRSRFAVELTRAVVEAVGHERVGFRVSPWSEFQAMKMEHDLAIAQFTHLLGELKALRLAYLHIVESRVAGAQDSKGEESLRPFTEVWGRTSPILIAGGYTPESAREALEKKYADQDVAIVFGRYFISTPDLVYRVRHGIPLNKYNRDKFYGVKQKEGYIDYPFSEEFLNETKSKTVVGSA